jgi:hypothetical protein
MDASFTWYYSSVLSRAYGGKISSLGVHTHIEPVTLITFVPLETKNIPRSDDLIRKQISLPRIIA